MHKLWKLTIIVLMTVVFVPQVGLAQDNDTPYIARFETNLDRVTPDEAESGEKMALLSWNISGVQDDHEVMLQVEVLGQWHDALPASADLNARDIISHPVPHSLTMSPPLFRLIVRNADSEILASQELEIPYQEPDLDANPPIIGSFEPAIESISPQDVRAGAVLIPVSWTVENRPAGANLIFEQVLPDGTSVSAELPRAAPWVRSTGDGVVSPRLTGEDEVTLRLSMVHFETGDVYASRSFSLSVPGIAGDSDGQSEDAPQAVVSSFTASRETVSPGGALSLHWQTENASRVFIEYLTADQVRSSWTYVTPTWASDELPPNGSLQITIPEAVTSGPLAFYLHADSYNWHDRSLADAILTVNLQEDGTPRPRALSFTAGSTTVQSGGALTLSWQTQNTEQVYVEVLVPDPERSGYIKRHSVSDALAPNGSYTASIPATLAEGMVIVNLYLNTLTPAGRDLAGKSLNIPVSDN